MNTMLKEALSYAKSRVPVFPCAPGSKEPLTHNGFYGATCDPVKIRRWWMENPDANIATPTGYLGEGFQSIDVLDIDSRPGGNGFSLYYEIKAAGFLENCYAVIETPSGGMHAYYKGTTQKSGSLRGKYVDFKATGGYVLLPPSVVNGRKYKVAWKNLFADITGKAGAIDWIAIQEQFGPVTVYEDGKEVTYGDYQIEYLATYLMKQKEGNRNNALHWAVCRAVEAGYAKAEFDPLISAALLIGLEPEEIAATIKSAMRSLGVQSVKRTRATG